MAPSYFSGLCLLLFSTLNPMLQPNQLLVFLEHPIHFLFCVLDCSVPPVEGSLPSQLISADLSPFHPSKIHLQFPFFLIP